MIHKKKELKEWCEESAIEFGNINVELGKVIVEYDRLLNQGNKI